jgi:hypothetical protein
LHKQKNQNKQKKKNHHQQHKKKKEKKLPAIPRIQIYVYIPPPPPDLTCDDISARNFEVLPPPDPHGFYSNDNDEIGFEIGSNQPDLDGPDNNSGSDNLLDLYG